MTSECMACSNFSSIGKYSTISASSGSYLYASVSGSATIAVKMPCNLSNAFVMYLGSSSASFSTSSSVPSGLSEVVSGMYSS